MPSVLEKVNQLKPTTYQFKNALATETTDLKEGSIAETYGFLAQDVLKVFPHLVKHHVEKDRILDTYSLDYSGFAIIAIKAIQEQQATIGIQQAAIEKQEIENKEQNAKIEQLTQLVNKLSLNPNAAPTEKPTGTFLGFCTPNPNSNGTRISYGIPANATGAELVISNDTGQRVKQLTLNSTGQVEIDTSSLGTGTYFYSLYLNGKLVDTKKMMVTR
jgi:hypothetical protein